MKIGIWLLVIFLAGCVAGPRIDEVGPESSKNEAGAAVSEDRAAAQTENSAAAAKQAPSQQEQVRIVVRLAKELRYYRDGTLEDYTEFRYDSSGMLSREERYSTEDELLQTIEYRYDGGCLAEKITYAGSQELQSVHRYTCTPEGFMETDSLFDADDEKQISSRYAYDDRGNRMRWEIFDSAGTLMARTEYLYEGGRPAGVEIYTAEGTLSDFSTVEYDEQGRKTRESFYTAPKEVAKYTLFAYVGDLLDSESSFDAKGNLAWKNLYQHDEEGLLVNTIFLDGRENVKEIVEREYALIEINQG